MIFDSSQSANDGVAMNLLKTILILLTILLDASGGQ